MVSNYRPQRGRPPGHCNVCRHADRTRIELLLAGGASQHAVGQKFGLSKDSVRRHWVNHVSAERRAALVMGPVQVQALAARVAEESGAVLDHHKATRAGLYKLFAAMLDAGDAQTGALVAGKLTDVNNAIARITGELAQSPLVQNNSVHLVMGSPQVQEFLTELARLLGPWPDARRTVASWLEARSRRAVEGVVQAPAEALPALEHAA